MLRMRSGYRLRVEVSYLGYLNGGRFSLDQKEILSAQFFDLNTLPDGLLPSHRDLIHLAFAELRDETGAELNQRKTAVQRMQS